MGSHSILQGILLTQGLSLGGLYCLQIIYCLSHQRRPQTRFWSYLHGDKIRFHKRKGSVLQDHHPPGMPVASPVCYLCFCCCLVTKSCPSLLWPCGLRTVAHQAPLSMGFSRQEDWSGLPFPPPGDLPDPGTEPLNHQESPNWLQIRGSDSPLLGWDWLVRTKDQMKRYTWCGPEQRSFCPPGAWGLAWWHWKHPGSPAFFIFLKKDQRAVLLGFHGDFNHWPWMTDSAQPPIPSFWKSGSRTESNNLLIIRFVPLAMSLHP